MRSGLALALLLAACSRDAPPAKELTCPAGELDDAGSCVPVECGRGTWGNLDVDGDTVFVDASAEEGGDGAEAAPFQTIGDGLDAAEATGADMVAVAAGTYTESVQLGSKLDGLHLAGRCSALVDNRASADDETGLTARGGTAQWRVSGLGFTGFAVGVEQRSGSLSLDGVDVTDSQGLGVLSYDSARSLRLNRVVVRGTRPAEVDPETASGVGIWMDGGSLEVANAAITDNRYSGIVAASASVRISNSEVSGTRADDDALGSGIFLYDAELEGEDLVIADNTETGIAAVRSALVLSGLEVSDTRLNEEGEGGIGIYAYGEGGLSLSSSHFAGNHLAAVNVVSSEASLTDLHIEGTLGDAEGYGAALQFEHATVVLSNSMLADNLTYGVLAADAEVSMENVEIHTTLMGAVPGAAIGIIEGSTLDATGVLLADNDRAGLLVDDSDATWSGGTISGTRLGTDDSGWAISVQFDASLDLSDCALVGNHLGIGVYDATATISHVTIEDTRQAQQTTVSVAVNAEEGSVVQADDLQIQRTQGPALLSMTGASLSCSDCTLEESTYAAAMVYLGGTLVLGPDVRIAGTAADATLGGGVGVLGGFILPSSADEDEQDYGPVTLQMVDVSVADSALAAVYLAGQGSYVLEGCSLQGGLDDDFASVYPFGNALFAVDGVERWDAAAETGLLVRDSALAASAGGGVFLHDASATLEGNTYEDNAPDLVQQGCRDGVVSPVGVEDLDTTSICPEYDARIERLDFYLRFPPLELEP